MESIFFGSTKITKRGTKSSEIVTKERGREESQGKQKRDKSSTTARN